MPDLIAVNIPKDVDRYFKETKEGNPDYTDAQAWATAWSRFCKYKNPGSDHCQQPASAYFPGKSASRKELPIQVKHPERLDAAAHRVVRDFENGDISYKDLHHYMERKGYEPEPLYPSSPKTGGPLSLRRDYGSVKQASSFDAPAAIRMMRQMRKGKRVNFDKGMAHRFGGTTYEKMEDGPDGRWVMASGMTGNIPFGWEDHPEWLQTPEEVIQREAKHSFGVSETWKHGSAKRASTGQECEFFKARDGNWYMGLSDYPPEDDDERDYWDPEYDYYGPFASFDEAKDFLRRGFANPGGYTKDDSGHQAPPKKPISPSQRWRYAAAKRVVARYLGSKGRG